MNSSAQKLEGVYSFNRQEMIAAFRFGEDSSFDFYYSYGAVDRNATGKFFIVDDTLKLKSAKEPGKDFNVTNQSKMDGETTITIKDKNSYLIKYVNAFVIANGTEKIYEADDNGVIKIDMACDSIYLQHQLFPDIPTLIKDEKNNNNNFEVALNPSLQQVSFKGIDFIINGKTISCLPNYFMPMENITFTKEEE